jgi:endonuclease YncB( thermonuclease family)
MTRFHFLAALVMLSAPASADTITNVIDGDTYQIATTWLPEGLAPFIDLRLAGIDTPEKDFRAKCPAEMVLGIRAAAYARKLLRGADKVSIQYTGWDKYGGRADGHLTLDGQDMAEALLAAGLAKPYDGAGGKPDWCSK